MFEGDYKQVWEYALKHMKAYGTGPTDEAIKVQFPTYEWDFPSPEPISFFIDLLKKKYAFNLTLVGIQSAYEKLNQREVDQAVDHLREALRQIEDATSSEVDLDWGATVQDRYTNYLEVQSM